MLLFNEWMNNCESHASKSSWEDETRELALENEQ